MAQIPQDKLPESSLALLLDGYNFIAKRRQRYGSDIFMSRLLLQKTICIGGEDAARLFYDNARFVRKAAIPKPIQKTLFGQGGVHSLDDESHRQRKQMFMSLMSKEGIRRLADLTGQEWENYLKKWEKQPQIVLYDEVHEILGRAVCHWAGVPLPEAEVKKRVSDLSIMVDDSATIGPGYVRARLGRARTESWVRGIIQQIRARQLDVARDSAAYVIAMQRDLNGELLPVKIAAVELLNVLRPTVAIAIYITDAARALHDHPQHRSKLADDAACERFVQEVRRFYPFTPFLPARVRQSFVWQGYHFPKGTRTMLDVHGINHDPRIWQNPEKFEPERFASWDGSAFNFIPQGGGDFYTGHRCPGEWITIELTKVATRFLATAMDYDIPPQNLRYSLRRFPSRLKSRFVITNVKPVPAAVKTLQKI
jgi:fatty-acid peroxygenase